MSVYVAPALADLEGRAGPADTDPAWFEVRALGATATGVRDVWLLVQAGATVEDAAAAVARQRLKARTGSGPEAAWGTQMEPVIAGLLQRQYGIRAESRVFSSQINSRFLASPDGIGVDFDEQLELAEVKTGAPRFFGWDAAQAKGYHVQMAWQMFVCVAVRCRYLFMERLGTRQTGFEPGATFAHTLEWADVADLVHDELVPIAEALIAAIDRILDEQDDEIDRGLDSLAIDVIHGREIEAEGKAIKEPAWQALLAECEARGVRVEQESAFARVLYTPATSSGGGTEEVRVVDEGHPEVVRARQAVVDAQAELAAVEDAHSRVESRPAAPVKKAAKLTVSDPQRRKAK